MYDKEWRERERVGEVARAMERERDSMKKMGERERGRGGERAQAMEREGQHDKDMINGTRE